MQKRAVKFSIDSVMNEQLLSYLFDDKPHILAEPMREWLDSSRRFQDFATTYRNKIRKKIRITHGDSAILDLGVELESGYRLIQQKRFTVTYEPYGSQKTRGPDFGVLFKSLTFNVEVTRIDSSNMERDSESGAYDLQQINGRMMDTVCDKLGQMRPGMINVLQVVTDNDFFAVLDIDEALGQLKARAEQKDEGLFGRYGFVKTADFFKYYLRLSGVLVRPIDQQTMRVPVLWLNNQAKQPLPGSLQTILKRN